MNTLEANINSFWKVFEQLSPDNATSQNYTYFEF